MTERTVVEICAGAGGQSLGLHLAGFRHIRAVELDPQAAATLEHNLARVLPGTDPADVVSVGDVADPAVWHPEDYTGAVDLLAGGVPCPPFSYAGRRLGALDERDLFAFAVELAGRVKPKALLLENVRGLYSRRFSGYRQAVLDRLAELGFVAHWTILEARDFGVPQLRPRTVLVALQEPYAPYFRWPEPSTDGMTVGTALRDLMGANGFPYIDEWVQRADGVAPTIVGGSKKHGGADLGPTRAKSAWEALWVDGHGVADAAPGPTWRRSDHPRGPRLTTEMVATLQGWDGAEYYWEFLGRKTSRYRQIGNAFPPPVARSVGNSILAALRRSGPPSRDVDPSRSHNSVYQTLRRSGTWVSLKDLARAMSGADPVAAVAAAIEHLAEDFEVSERMSASGPEFKLGAWRAFIGQPEHSRHAAFAAPEGRRRIS